MVTPKFIRFWYGRKITKLDYFVLSFAERSFADDTNFFFY